MYENVKISLLFYVKRETFHAFVIDVNECSLYVRHFMDGRWTFTSDLNNENQISDITRTIDGELMVAIMNVCEAREQ